MHESTKVAADLLTEGDMHMLKGFKAYQALFLQPLQAPGCIQPCPACTP